MLIDCRRQGAPTFCEARCASRVGMLARRTWEYHCVVDSEPIARSIASRRLDWIIFRFSTMNKGNDTGSMGTSVEPSDRKRTVEEGNDLEKNNSSAMNDQTDRGSAAPKPKRIKSKHQEPSVRAIRSVIQQCCARNDLRKAIEAYEKTIADKTRLEPQSFYNLLSLCDGLSDRGIHVGTPKLSTDNDQKDLISTQHVDEESRLRYAKRIKEHMDQLKLPLTETAWSALVKLHSRNHQFDLAEQHLTEAESTQQCRPKLRMYSALLVAYCEIGRMQDALIVWLRLSKINLAVSEREYLALIQCATKYGFARVMERVLQDLSEDVLVPSKETSRALEEWFQSAYATNATVANDSVAIDSILQQIQAPSADQLPATFKFKIQSATGWVVSSGCPVEMTSGELLEGCLKNCNLKPVTISEQCWLEMKEMNETIVSSGKIDGDMSGVQGGRKGPKRQVTDREQRKKYWSLFHSFLERQCSVGKFDVIIDGANVGYYQQNYQSAPRHVDYRQIDWLVKHFQKENKKGKPNNSCLHV
ncbi:hypothetical protein MPSEU_000255400 [Mayamaea pseudoterrestris]|nr:hypothetical protein MPSEU_000255400 [Mayamaea pseudoterrestris]